MIETQV